ncbi:MAG TPA: hypothetical protein DIU37_04760 [Opitutae bacterium]|nr:hypothetical protein [Opitutae bacterium]|tara:strand:+ start:900 stop:1979 length:1080 start_codon:yes stop_codon:yes gene_type:complete
MSSGTQDPIRITLFASTQGAYGGVEAHVLSLAKQLHGEPEYAIKVVFKCVKGHTIQKQLVDQCKRTEVPHTFIQRSSIDVLKILFKTDIVHVNNVPPDIVIPAKILKKPVIATIHHQGKTNNKLRHLLWKFSASLANIRCYDTNFVRKIWEETLTKSNSYTRPACSELPESEIHFEKRSGFFFVGRWIENKGIDTLIQAYDQAGLNPKIWPLYLAGDGPLRPWAETFIQEHQIKGVHILGFITEEQKWERIRNAKWMVTPPDTLEDQGLTPIEARSQAVPSIITRDGGLPEAAGTSALMCEPNDIDALAETLKTASTMTEEEYKARALKGYESLKDYLTPLDFYKKLYSTVLHKGSTIP